MSFTAKQDQQNDILYWKGFTQDTGTGAITSGHSGEPWYIGHENTYQGEPLCCRRGYHASKYLQHAFGYVSGPVLGKVSFSGAIDMNSDKIAVQSMVLVTAYTFPENILERAQAFIDSGDWQARFYADNDNADCYDNLEEGVSPRIVFSTVQQWMDENKQDTMESVNQMYEVITSINSPFSDELVGAFLDAFVSTFPRLEQLEPLPSFEDTTAQLATLQKEHDELTIKRDEAWDTYILADRAKDAAWEKLSSFGVNPLTHDMCKTRVVVEVA